MIGIAVGIGLAMFVVALIAGLWLASRKGPRR